MKSFAAQNFVRLQRKFLFAVLLLPLISGCLPVGNTYKDPMAVRFVKYGNTNYVTEKLIETDAEFGLGMIVSPEGPGTAHISQKQSFYLETVGKMGFNRIGFKMAKIKNLPNPKDLGEVSDWNFWPVPETNLWMAADSSSYKFSRNKGDSPWDKEVYLKVYLFNPKIVLREKQLMVFVPEHDNDGYPDFRFDAQYQQITYKTRSGYETYNFGEDTVIPCEAPSGEPALPIKNHGKGFDLPLTLFIQGRPTASYREANGN
jgi:hypothetical protein